MLELMKLLFVALLAAAVTAPIVPAGSAAPPMPSGSAASQEPTLDAGAGADVVPDATAQVFEELAASFPYRNLGPFRAGAWVSDVAFPTVPPEDASSPHRHTFYVASRTGGLFRTTNNGTTFEPVFDDQPYLAIGDVAVAPSDAEVVWVGTGGAEAVRSTYRGNGVWRSTDGGETWEHLGLEDTHHIARIVVHPDDPDTAWVAAMGHLFSTNEARGVYRTRDGGTSWDRVLWIGDEVGAVDLVASPTDPSTLYAATYEKVRLPWHFEAGGPRSGVWKSDDGGDSWERLGGGLPDGQIGRIGLGISRSDPDVIYAVVENVNERPPTEEEAASNREAGREPQPRPVGGEVYRSDDAGRSWRRMNEPGVPIGAKAAYSFNQIRVDPSDPDRVYVTGVTIARSEDGGRSWVDVEWPPRQVFPEMFGDVRALWIDPWDSRHIVAGTDGGIHVSRDGGATSDFFDNLPLGEIYAVDVDMEDPYNVYVGLQDHESWRGPSNSWSGAVTLEDWITVGTGDGMYNRVDPTDSRWLYNTLQFGSHRRVDQLLRERVDIEPSRPDAPAAAEDPAWDPLRFTWTTPIVVSAHRPEVIYTGAQVLLRSDDRGDTWVEISPDLTTNDPVKIAGEGHIQYCTITTISESPVTPDVIWAGTDDGKVWVTRNGGASWREATEALSAAGAPADRWVSRVFASPHDEATALVAKSGYRRDDFRPYLYRTTDLGESWEPIAGDLPDRPINVVVQDRVNPALLYVGNDDGVWVSVDGGADWARLGAKMPRVPVRDLVVHPREHDLVAGTYARGAWIADVSVLQQVTPELLGRLARGDHLFEIEPRGRLLTSGWGNYRLYGDRHIVVPNEPDALTLTYWIGPEAGAAPADAPTEDPVVTLSIREPDGDEIRRLEGPATPGIHRVLWDLRDADDEHVQPGRYAAALLRDDRELRRAALVEEPVRALPDPIRRGDGGHERPGE